MHLHFTSSYWIPLWHFWRSSDPPPCYCCWTWWLLRIRPSESLCFQSKNDWRDGSGWRCIVQPNHTKWSRSIALLYVTWFVLQTSFCLFFRCSASTASNSERKEASEKRGVAKKEANLTMGKCTFFLHLKKFEKSGETSQSHNLPYHYRKLAANRKILRLRTKLGVYVVCVAHRLRMTSKWSRGESKKKFVCSEVVYALDEPPREPAAKV